MFEALDGPKHVDANAVSGGGFLNERGELWEELGGISILDLVPRSAHFPEVH